VKRFMRRLGRKDGTGCYLVFAVADGPVGEYIMILAEPQGGGSAAIFLKGIPQKECHD
jgi:hypothetical protein